MKKRLLSILLAVTLSISAVVISPRNVMANEQMASVNEAISWNFNQKDISLSGNTSTKFLSGNNNYSASIPKVVSFWDASGKYNVVQKCYDSDNQSVYVMIQKYNQLYELTDTIKINSELPAFGNIICDGNYYYILWGQSDGENQNIVVTNLSKYSLDGTKIADCEINGYDSNPYSPWGSSGSSWGTSSPFNHGTVRMTIQNGVLACIYARKMYNGHQSDFCFYVDTDSMKRLDSNAVTYCSHSFDQAALATSDGGFLYVNHGDAYGRAFVVDYVNDERQWDRGIESFHFREGTNRSYGYNETYAQLGGIAETDNGYVLCGSSEKTLSYDNAPTSGSYCGHSEARNLFVQVLKKDFYNYANAQDCYAVPGEVREATGNRPESSQTELFLPEDLKDYGVIWLTDYDDSYYVNNPKVVVTEDNRIIILWEKISYDTLEGSTYFAIYDHNMNVIQSESEIPNVYLPGNTDLTYHDGKINWVTNDNYGQKINELDLNYDQSNLKKQSAKIQEGSLTLAGDININFYIEISDGLERDANTAVEVTGMAGKKKILLSSMEKQENGRYKLSYPVAAAQMKDEFTAQVVCRNNIYCQSSFSVRKYADYILAHQNESSEYKKAAPLVKALLNYGGYAQQYFGYHTSDLANNGIYTNNTDPVLTQKISGTTIGKYDYDNFYDNFYMNSDENTDIKYYGESLVCNDFTQMNIYFSLKSPNESYDGYAKGNISSGVMTDLAYLDGDSMENFKNYDSKIKDGKLCISVYDILPQNFDRIFSYSVYKEGEGTFSIPFSPMQYIFKAMKSKDGKLANLSKAMYWYWDAAKTYTM